MTLEEQGWKYMYRGKGQYGWTHPACIEDNYVDCTDMSDDEFGYFVHRMELEEYYGNVQD